MSGKQGVCVLGATGSIGTSTLDVIARHQEKFELIAISANSNVDKMLEICHQHRPKIAVMVDEISADELDKKLELDIKIESGPRALDAIATLDTVDYVMAAIVGDAGLSSALAAIRAGKNLLLANKESLVMSGQIFMAELAKSKARLVPIDSEHNAIFQCLPDDFTIGSELKGVKRILLTGSGGPFLNSDIKSLDAKTPAEAISHPNWDMGAKISVDSATMMNKGLEWLEAKWLFGIADQALQIVIHPQSIIHSMVEFVDGSILAQLGKSDMRIPIAHAFGLPQRIKSGVAGLDFYDLPELQFKKPDLDRFPCLRLAEESWQRGGTATTVLNAANEVAVEKFLQGKIKFTKIARIIEDTLTDMQIEDILSLEQVLTADKAARFMAQEKARQ